MFKIIIDFYYQYKAARACGLNVMNSIYVAHGDMTLSEALGDMDVDQESAFMAFYGLGEEDLQDDFAGYRKPCDLNCHCRVTEYRCTCSPRHTCQACLDEIPF